MARPAAGQVVPERPREVTLPSGRRMPVDPVSTAADGSLRIPRDVAHAGWWTGSSRLGDPFGSIVLAAHVDSFTQGVGPFVELASARPGEPVALAGRRLHQRYRVASVGLVPRGNLASQSRVFSSAGAGRLVLITCGGPYDAAHGGYQDNVVLMAQPVGAR